MKVDRLCSQVKRKDLLLGKRLEKLLIKFIIDAKVSVATVLPRRFWYTQRSAIPTEEITIYVSEIMEIIEEKSKLYHYWHKLEG
jgi:hypothetical protein